jgi:hypothetical protein
LKIRFLTPLLFAGLLAAVSEAAQTEWKEFVWREGRCSILMPGEPRELKIPTGGVGDTFIRMVEKGNNAWAVTYLDVPGMDKAPKDVITQALVNGRDGAAKSTNGKLLSDRDIKLGEHPGKEFELELPGGMLRYRSRVYIVSGRLYQMVVTGPRDVVQGREADRFLESFKLLDAGK